MSMQNMVRQWWKCGLLLGLCFVPIEVQSCIADARISSTEVGKGICVAGSLELAGDRARPPVNGLNKDSFILHLTCDSKEYVTGQIEIIILASQKPNRELSCTLRADGIAKCSVPTAEKK